MKPFAILLLSCLFLLNAKQAIGYSYDFFGCSVDKIGDINGDGYDDIVIAASNHAERHGAVYIFYGRDTSNLCDIDLHNTSLDPATTGFTIWGSNTTSIGDYVSSAGDINGDGYDDIVISGSVPLLYVIYGGPTSSLGNIDLSKIVLDPATTGFTIKYGPERDMLFDLARAGDVNGDGYGDIIFAKEDVITNLAKIFVLYGRKTAELSNIDITKTALDPATTGFTIEGKRFIGTSVNGAGDIDQDGYDDITFVAPNGSASVAYVIYGGPKSKLSNINLLLTILNPAKNGFTVVGTPGSWNNAVVSNFGDINGDGYPDFIFGLSAESKAGRVYVIYGGPRSSLANLDLTKTPLDPATTGFNVTGEITITNYSSDFGYAVSIPGDINQDGYQDLLIGAPWMSDATEDEDQGKSYVIYGGPTASLKNIDLGTSILDPTSTGFTINGNVYWDELGSRVSSAGDMNKDGYDDLLVAAPFKSLKRGGAYVIYGGPNSNRSNIDLSRTALNPAQTGFTILGDYVSESSRFSRSALQAQSI